MLAKLNQRTLVILLMGFASGLPIVLTASTLQAWYTSAGVDLMTIGILTLVGQPYVYKFLWAPLFDRYAPLNIDKRRSWILLMQLGLVIGLASMAFMHPEKNPLLLASIALIVAIFSASQDIAIDAYRTDMLPEVERGLGAAFTTLGYRGAMLVAGAVALILADYIGWRNTYLIMAALIVIEMMITWFSPKVENAKQAPSTLTQAVVTPIVEFLRRPYAIALILFIIIYKLSDVFALVLNTTFLLREVGFTLTELGAITKIVGLAAALIGSLIGGILLPYLGLYRSLFIFGFLQIVASLPYAILAVVGKSFSLMIFTVFFEYLCGSLGGVALIVLLMDLCDKRYTATQYALFSALSAVGRVFVGPLAAYLVGLWGWTWFYIFGALMGMPAMLVLVWLDWRYDLFARVARRDLSLTAHV